MFKATEQFIFYLKNKYQFVYNKNYHYLCNVQMVRLSSQSKALQLYKVSKEFLEPLSGIFLNALLACPSFGHDLEACPILILNGMCGVSDLKGGTRRGGYFYKSKTTDFLIKKPLIA